MEGRRVLLTCLAGYEDDGVDAKELQRVLGWSASEVNALLQAGRVDEEVIDLPNGRVRLAPRLRDQIRPVHPGSPLSPDKAGDQYNVYGGQVGAMGHGATAHDNVSNVISLTGGDLQQLSRELSVLRARLRNEAETLEQQVALGAVAEAEIAAKEGRGPQALAALKRTGTWTLQRAQEVGTQLVADILSKTSPLR